MDLDEYQAATARMDIRPEPHDVALPLLGLAGEVGSLVAEYKKRLRDGESYSAFEVEVREDLGDLLWYTATLARTVGLSLSDVAASNIQKTELMFGDALPAARQYDSAFPLDQQLPRQFAMRFEPATGKDGLPRVAIFLGRKVFGDRLDDNAYEDDGYRFHDAFHLAHAAVLGWSPVTRALLKRKRKSDVLVDRVEDGARAIAHEEGLAAFIFSEAVRYGYFRDATNIGWNLLKVVTRMVARLEVGDQPPNAWRRAILQGYGVWHQLREHNGGVVECDLDARSVVYARQ